MLLHVLINMKDVKSLTSPLPELSDLQHKNRQKYINSAFHLGQTEKQSLEI